MARLNFNRGSGAFFELILTDREEGRGAIVHLRIPKGAGRSSFVFHEEFVLGKGPDDCLEFVAKLSPEGNGQGIAILRNDTAYFSFLLNPDGKLLFEACCSTGFGELAFRANVAAGAAGLFHRNLEAVCRKLSKNGARREVRAGPGKGNAG